MKALTYCRLLVVRKSDFDRGVTAHCRRHVRRADRAADVASRGPGKPKGLPELRLVGRGEAVASYAGAPIAACD